MAQPFRVLISDKMSPRAAEALAASPAVHVDFRPGLSAEELEAAIGEYHGLIVRSASKVTAKVLDAASELRIIGRAGIGVDNIDVGEASRRGIVVENTPSGNAVTTAEHAICLLLSLARNIPQATASMREGRWEKSKFGGSELYGKTLGVVGLGNIGRIVADRARGLKMRVIGHDPFIGKEAAARLGIELVDFDTLCSTADFITIHTPLSDATRGLIGTSAFAKMKPGVLLVNAARGGIVDEAALGEALASGTVAGAALDVFETEPVPVEHPLLKNPRVICTPHLGASTGEAQDKVALEIAEQFVAYAEHGEIRNAVNLAPMPPDLREELAPWLALCTQMGRLIAQLATNTGGGAFVDELTVEVIGDVGARGATPCANAALVGLLGASLEHPVNEVNAPIVATERGLKLKELKTHKGEDFASAVALTARCGGETRYVKGTLYHIGGHVAARVVQIDDFLVEARPKGRLLIVWNDDTPGVIGAVGTKLGEQGINVNSLHVGLDKEAGVAIAAWNVDAAVAADLLGSVNALPQVQNALVVEL